MFLHQSLPGEEPYPATKLSSEGQERVGVVGMGGDHGGWQVHDERLV